MPAFPAIVVSTLVIKFLGLIKAVTNRDVNSAVTILGAWAAGAGALFLAGATVWSHTKGFDIGGFTLSDLDGPSKFVAGAMLGSTGSVVYDVKKALDGTDSASEPKLLPGAPDNG